ncbi:MAG: phospholipase D-like domain-containing protein [Terracidiphilus sp.]
MRTWSRFSGASFSADFSFGFLASASLLSFVFGASAVSVWEGAAEPAGATGGEDAPVGEADWALVKEVRNNNRSGMNRRAHVMAFPQSETALLVVPLIQLEAHFAHNGIPTIGKNIRSTRICIHMICELHERGHSESGLTMKLLIQPDDGVEPIVRALGRAKKSIQILVFRIDRNEVENALLEAVQRGVAVQALIAYTNRGGDKDLRRFEMRLLEKGITVARTSDDLLRYHGKMMIIDGKELHIFAFNFSHLDIALSRSFGVSTTAPKIVKEAVKLFECDVRRTAYTADCDELVVSPANARQQLSKFIEGAKKQLLMYEMKISDPEFVKLLNEKISQGLDVRVIGQSSVRGRSLPIRTMPTRLHARAILRDGSSAFLGSQSLRKLELEVRREIGIIFHDMPVVKRMISVFDSDWRSAAPAVIADPALTMLEAPAKKVARVVAKRLDVESKIEQVLDKVIDSGKEMPLEPEEVVETVRAAVREEVRDAVVQTVRELVTEVAHSGNLLDTAERNAKL